MRRIGVYKALSHREAQAAHLTASLDLTVAADRAQLESLRARLASERFHVAREHGA
jgi:hypothetical protein